MADPRLARSREQLIAAITVALDHPGDEQPSITDLCSAARVSRPTFYQHFGDVPSLVEAAALERMHALFAAVVPPSPQDDWETAVPRVVRGLLSGLLEHADFYRRALSGGTARSVQESVVAFLAQRLLAFSPLAAQEAGDRARVERFAVFLAAGTVWLVVGWLLDGDDRRPVAAASAEIAELLVTGVASPRLTAPATDSSK
ncbi:TetR/AcrR family transcriptional regulator [Rathayibacter sp. VKM Ac-2927]|uniref:TetR/AcrR family transcriptional regulator n=1 Tax=Rathayibacter sp. VKM Ac-2927 TaxID=2929478 RepID=UPI001FB44404|nr:TetR/AcrR family transcriptional regulator [Rathayibacter sp. VKM Ac-2927]MCJ1686864.1 TetR/AcrR family transcriptional regulator [Rathayibacter sp. VKM Ac-2927]